MKEKFSEKLKKECGNIVFKLAFILATFITVVLLYRNILATTLITAGIGLIGLMKWKSKLTLAIYILCGFLGVVLESIAINYGAWTYSFYNIINVPSWLFFVWGNTAASIQRIALILKNLGIK